MNSLQDLHSNHTNIWYMGLLHERLRTLHILLQVQKNLQIIEAKVSCLDWDWAHALLFTRRTPWPLRHQGRSLTLEFFQRGKEGNKFDMLHYGSWQRRNDIRWDCGVMISYCLSSLGSVLSYYLVLYCLFALHLCLCKQRLFLYCLGTHCKLVHNWKRERQREEREKGKAKDILGGKYE